MIKKLNCCRSPELEPHYTDLGHQDSCDFMLSRCIKCGAYWMNVFCDAGYTSGYEKVSDEEAKIMLSTPPGPQLKAFIKEWFWKQE